VQFGVSGLAGAVHEIGQLLNRLGQLALTQAVVPFVLLLESDLAVRRRCLD